jgi:hypothetical protein
VPNRDSNFGLPYSKPTRYYLSHAAPHAMTILFCFLDVNGGGAG